MATGNESAPTGRRLGLLRVAFDQAVTEMTDRVRLRHADVRPAHMHVFRRQGIDGLRITDLAAHAGMTKQSMHALVDHLEAHGYLHREPDPEDERGRILRLTRKGRNLQSDVQDAAVAVLQRWREVLGSERFDGLWAALQVVTGESSPLPEVGDLQRSRPPAKGPARWTRQRSASSRSRRSPR